MKLETRIPAAQLNIVRDGQFWQHKTLLDDFRKVRASKPNALAIVGRNTMTGKREALTWRDLGERVDSLIAAFSARGIGPGDVISAQLPNWWEMIGLHLACLAQGAIFNPLMPIFRERELEFMLGLAESKLIIVPERFRDCDHVALIRNVVPRLPDLKEVLVIGMDGTGSFDRLLKDPANPLPRANAAAPDDVIQLLYTSGTTGEPKGVMHTSNTLMATLAQHIRIWGLSERDVTLMGSPMAHQTGFLYGIMSPIMTGGRVVLQDIWNARQAVELIEQEGVTFSIGSTPFLADLLEAAKDRPQALRSLRFFVAAGAPIPRHLVGLAKDEFNVSVCSMWGMSENGPAAFTRPNDPPARTLETDGCAAPGIELKVVEESTAPLAPGQEGRLMVRGAGMFVGYLKRPHLYAPDDEGWFDTGDLARMDADGYLRITGRSKDLVIRGGENIPVVEIENLIYQHPAVAETAIVAMPDPRLNERACAFVVLRPGRSLDLAELTEFLLSKKCSKSYLPERLEVVDTLPRTLTGKIQKFRLREISKEFASQQ